MKKDDTVYLRHVLDAIELIGNYVQDTSIDQFMETRLLQDGVVRQLEIIGEASRNLSEEFRQVHPEIPWNEIIAFRNRVVHAYFDMDLHVVWEIVQEDLSTLQRQVELILSALDASSRGQQ